MYYHGFMESLVEYITVGDIGTNCWFYRLEADDSAEKRPCAVIDPGDEAGLIISTLRKLNWVPRYIFLTHGHFDHLAALPGLLEEFGGAAASPQIGVHRLDANYLGKNSLDLHRDSMIAAGGPASYVEALWKPLPEADLLFEEGDTAGPFKVLHMPGHSQGSVAYYNEKNQVLFSGDTLFQGNWGRTDLPGGNEAQLYQSLKRLLKMKPEIVVCPGHGPPTSIKDEQRIAMYLG